MSYSSYTPNEAKQSYVNPDSSVSDGSHPANPYSEGKRIPLTQDEIRVIKECNAESFYYRCMPFGALFSGLAYIAMKHGYLMKSPSYGYAPKIGIAAVAGYILGKFSYQGACAEKIMKLENSPLAENLRRRRGQLGFHSTLSMEPESGVTYSAGDFSKDAGLEERRPDLSEHAEGSDSYDRVTESLSPYLSEEEGKRSPESYVSYDDLRRANREDYANKMMERYRRPPESSSPLPPVSSDFPSTPAVAPDYAAPSGGSPPYSYPQEPTPKPPPPYFDRKKNKYGDVWDD